MRHPQAIFTRLWQTFLHARKRQSPFLLSVGGVTVFVALVRSLGLLQSLELACFDYFVRMRPLRWEASENRILVVTIEDENIQEYGWPLGDRYLSDMLDKLGSGGASWIGLDIISDQMSAQTYPRLNQILAKNQRIIGIEKLNGEDRLIIQPNKILQESDRVGFNNFSLDPDGKIRRNFLIWHVDGVPHYSLSLTLALNYLAQYGIKPEGVGPDGSTLKLGNAIFPEMHSWTDAKGKRFSNDGGYVNLPIGGYQLLANFRPPSLIKVVNIADILSGRVKPEEIKNRIVLIGMKADTVKDWFSYSYSEAKNSNFQTSGVELHANFLSQLLSAVLDDRPVMRPWPTHPLLIFLWFGFWTWGGAAVIWYRRSPGQGTLALLGGSALLTAICFGAFLSAYWLPLVPPLLGWFGAAAAVTSYLAYQGQELKRSKTFLDSIINTIPDPVFVKNQELRLIVVNEAFRLLVGESPEAIAGKSDLDLFEPEEAQRFLEEDRWIIENQVPKETESQLTDRKGDLYFISTKRSLHQDAAGNIFLVGVIRDITERKRLETELRRTAEELTRSNMELQQSENRLRYMANHDPLTGLPNRSLFQETLNDLIRWSLNNDQLLGLLFLDLDDFKPVNDNLGHEMGDLLLKAVAQRIKNCLRGSDVVCRLGGDEFTILLPGIKKTEDAAIVAQKIIGTLQENFVLSGHHVKITVSIGVSVCPHHAQEPETLIRLADEAMYEAKNRGRNTYFSTPETASAET